MFSQLLLSIDSTLGSIASPLLLTGLCAGLVFFSGQYLMRRRERRRSERPSATAIAVTEEERIESRLARSVRRAPVAVLVTDVAAEVPPVAGYVVNRSPNGLCLELEEEGEVAPGTALNVRPTLSGDSVPWVLVRVKQVNKNGSCWQLDCEYDRVPPYSVRMLFG